MLVQLDNITTDEYNQIASFSYWLSIHALPEQVWLHNFV